MITINLDKARGIAHDRRRAARAVAFEPHDERIRLALPGDDLRVLDGPRHKIREADAAVQTKIDKAKNVAALSALVGAL